jgi:hypothetical protein
MACLDTTSVLLRPFDLRASSQTRSIVSRTLFSAAIALLVKNTSDTLTANTVFPGLVKSGFSTSRHPHNQQVVGAVSTLLFELIIASKTGRY